MSEVPVVRELRRGRVGRLDHRAARVRRVLLRRRVRVSIGRPYERVQPRGRADAGVPRLQERAPGVLRAHQATAAGVALHGQRYENGFEKLPGHDRRGMRV